MKKTNMKVGGTVAMFALALGATGALAHGSDVKSNDPRQAVAMEEVVLVAKDGVLAGGGGGGDTGNGNCGSFLGLLLGNMVGNLIGNGGFLGGALIGNGNISGNQTGGNCAI
ncbi:hypothetical protein D7Y13_38935 [Corallococcus praedator]|uniref:Secreted protein n=1 Tax=Corallococcus praedator TaxID=2316724 RepID=A0ABX9Q5Y4_9BACT|nr:MULTISPECIES: hypothetical protein [Corallococcus]RKH15164.1 hypothetical protein D7X74_18885 [Corallococcus sp. CA047B]RKH29327.1 hypothetical protein D7X75_22985 [Corallococcus sp. CA031C]RKH91206.1 hypothetical protein D7Y13_38935 [Corallococcus praedator]